MVYTITCNPALDYTMQVPCLADGVSRSKREFFTFGGKGINVSAVLVQLEVPTCAGGFVGGFTGEKLKRLLTEAGIVHDFVSIDGDTRVNVKLKADTEWDINAAGPAVSEENRQALLQKMEALGTGDVLVLSGSVPRTLPAQLYGQLLKATVGRGILTVVDTEGSALRDTLCYRPFLIKPNHHELGALFARPPLTDIEEIADCARALQAEGARNVLVSRGAQGAFLLTEAGKTFIVANAPGTLRNSVGCGDSMIAGFLAGWLHTGDYTEALRWGTACGNATAFSDTLATKQEINVLLEKAVPVVREV